MRPVSRAICAAGIVHVLRSRDCSRCGQHRLGEKVEMPERTVSRVLSRTIIHLGQLSPTASSNLPGSPLGTGGAASRVLPYLVLLRAGFTVPRAVTSRAVRSYRTFSPLPTSRRFIFCGTVHGLAPPRCYLAPCPKEPGLSSVTQRVTAIAWPTPAFPDGILQEIRGRSSLLVALAGRPMAVGGEMFDRSKAQRSEP